MKKLLAIFGSLGLVTTTGFTIVSCASKPDPLQKTKNAAGTSIELNLTKTHHGETLNSDDQEAVSKAVISQLINVNNDAVADAQTFSVVNLDKITPEQIAIKVAVRPTEAKDGLLGLNAGFVKVKTTFIATQYGLTGAKGADAKVQLKETHLNETLTVSDRNLTENYVKDKLVHKNSHAANVTPNIFSFNLDDNLTVDGKLIVLSVNVKTTKPSNEKPGLRPDTVTVNLTLIPFESQQESRGATWKKY